MRLSTQSARDLQPGGIIRDHVVRGLELHAGATGKTWRLYYRAATGERRRPKVGYYPALTIEAAREAARAMLRQVAAGKDPSAERSAKRAAPTVSDLCDLYLEHSKSAHEKATQEQVERCIRLYVRPVLGKLKVADVTKLDVDGLKSRIEQGRFERDTLPGRRRRVGGRIAANRCMAYLSGMFKLAESDGYNMRPEGTNPVAKVAKNPERKRRVKIPANLFPAVHAELARLSPEYPAHVAAVYTSMLSGSRISELVTAARAELREGAIYREEHKTRRRTGDVRTIRLPRQALALLDALPVDPSGALFPGVDRWQVWKVWNIARERAGCPEVQPRDFRRTFASVAKSAGVSLSQIGELFDHKSTATTDRYAWLYDDAARESTQGVADKIETLWEGKEANRP